MPTIVLDHEQPHQKARGRNGEQQGQPPEAQVIGRPHQRPKQHEGSERDGELDRAARAARPLSVSSTVILIVNQRLYPYMLKINICSIRTEDNIENSPYFIALTARLTFFTPSQFITCSEGTRMVPTT